MVGTMNDIVIVGTTSEVGIIKFLEKELIRMSIGFNSLVFDQEQGQRSPSYQDVVNSLKVAKKVLICLGQDSTDIGIIISQAIAKKISTLVFVEFGTSIDPVIRGIKDNHLMIIEYRTPDELALYL